MKKLVWFIPGLLALVLGAYLGSQRTVPSVAVSPDSAVGSASLAEVQLPDVLGEVQDGSQWLGQVVVMNHWAAWCPPCVEEIPLLIDVQARYGAEGLQVVGVAHDSVETTRIFGDEFGINYPSLVVEQEGAELMMAQGNIHGGLPFTAIFDREGQLIRTKLGVFSADELHALVAQLLQ